MSQPTATVGDRAAGQPLLEVHELSVDIAQRRSTVHAVDGVSLAISPGQTLGLVGESGCGKSTLGLALLGLLPTGGHVTHGRVCLDGKELDLASDRAMRRIRGRRIGMVFQDPMTALNPTKTVGAQVSEPLMIHGTSSSRAARQAAVDMLGHVGLPHPTEQMDKYPHQLSGGMRQRVVIATALIGEPSLVIADEPTTALDVTTQDQILELFARLQEQMGMAILLITHDMGVIAGHAHQVAVMYAGQIVEQAATDRLFADHRHRYTEALLTTIPTLDTPKDLQLPSISGLPPALDDPPPGCRFAPRCAHATASCTDAVPPRREEHGHSFACIHPRRTAETARDVGRSVHAEDPGEER